MGPRLPTAIRNGAAWVRRFARTTPGVISAVAAISIVLCVISGIVCANQLGGKIDSRDRVLDRTEPLAYAGQRLYVALSAADAAAATAFLSGGIESPEVRARYQQALADAAAALAETTADTDDDTTRRLVARINAALPTYTGLVESARMNNRQGFPVGAAYLKQASALMQETLLPAADEIGASRLAAVRADQREIEGLPLASILAMLVVTAAGVAGSVVLLRRTNRLLNIGLVTGTGIAVLTLAWLLTATTVAATTVDTGGSGASTRFETLSRARILAQQARTDETLQLVTRDDLAASEKTFRTHTTDLEERLKSVLSADDELLREFANWMAGHRKQVEAYESGDYKSAVEQAIGIDGYESGAIFTRFDRLVGDGIAAARTELRTETDTSGNQLTGSPAGTALLMLLAATAVGAGLWPRLKEFL